MDRRDFLAGIAAAPLAAASLTTTAQAAALAALEQGEPHVERMRQEYDRRRRLIVDGFNTLGLDCFEPRGAFYAFPSVERSGMSSLTSTPERPASNSASRRPASGT